MFSYLRVPERHINPPELRAPDCENDECSECEVRFECEKWPFTSDEEEDRARITGTYDDIVADY